MLFVTCFFLNFFIEIIMQAGISLFLIDRLRHYNYRRNSCIKYLIEKSDSQQAHESGQAAVVKSSTLAPLFRILQTSIGFHGIIVFSTLIVIISIFSSTRSLTLFSLHPICMTLGSLLCISQGIVAYRNDSLLETLSPIMQHSKRTKVRSIHQTLQLTGVIFLLLGFLFILSHKIELRHSILPSSVHSIIGAIVILICLVQVVVGHDKLETLESIKKKVPTRKWHGDLGLLLWDVLCIAVLSGLWSVLKISLTHLLVELAVLIVWLSVHIQMMHHAPSGSVQSTTSKRKAAMSADSFEEDDEVYEDDADEVALLDMESSVTVTHCAPIGNSVLPGQPTESGNTMQSIQHNGHNIIENYVHKNSSGRKKYSDFYGFADDDEDGTFV